MNLFFQSSSLRRAMLHTGRKQQLSNDDVNRPKKSRLQSSINRFAYICELFTFNFCSQRNDIREEIGDKHDADNCEYYYKKNHHMLFLQ